METMEKIMNAGMLKVRIDVNGDVDFFKNVSAPVFTSSAEHLKWEHVFTITQEDLLGLVEDSERVSFENNIEEYEKVAERKEGGTL